MGFKSWLAKSFTNQSKKSVNPYVDSILKGTSQQHAGVEVNYNTAMRQADVYTCVRIISESIGMIPMKLYRKKNGALEEVSETTREAQIYCKQPNSYMSAQELNEYLITVLLLRGHSFLEVKRNSLETVQELLPMRYLNAVNLSMSTVGMPFANWVDHTGAARTSHPPFNEQGLFDIKLQTTNGYEGISPIGMMAEQIGTGIATQRHTAKVFENGTRLSGILTTDDTLDDDAIERLQTSWNGAYGGTDNAGKVAVLENNLQYTNITMTNQDAQLLEMLCFSREQIAAAFRVPVSMLNDTTASTMNNVEQNNLQFLKSTLMPIITKLESGYSRLLPDNMIARFDTRQFVRGDLRTQAEVAEILLKNRVISHEESRDMFDLAPSNDDHLFVIQSNNYVWGTKEDAASMNEAQKETSQLTLESMRNPPEKPEEETNDNEE